MAGNFGNTGRQSSYFSDLAMGRIPGHSLERKFGSIASIASGTPADVWEYGVTSGAETYTFSADNGTIGTADIDTMSCSAADTEIITIVGLDATGAEVIQLKALTGTTKVTLDSPLWRVNRVYNSNGTSLTGNVYVYVDGTTTTPGIPDDVTTVRGYVSSSENQTLQTIYTVPLGYTALIWGIETSLSKGPGATAIAGNFTGKSRQFGKVFRTQDTFDLNTSGTSRDVHNFPIPLPFAARTDFCPTVETTGTIGASWAINIELIQDGF